MSASHHDSTKPALAKVGSRTVGDGQPCYVVAEIGINHNGSLDIAKKMIEGAADAGVDAVKFQKRTPEVCVPKDQWHIERDTPWGRMTYIDYRHKVEFTKEQYGEIQNLCKSLKIDWFASCWDEPAVDFMEQFDVPCYKAASASLTDHSLLRKMIGTGKALMISTGMSTLEEIKEGVKSMDGVKGAGPLLIAHSTSSYPCKPDELNLKCIYTLKSMYPQNPIGYSGHEPGLAPTYAAVAMGATFVERHITLDRTMWGTDQAASVEITGLQQLIRNIRDIEKAMGDGVKRVYESEISSRKKLRRVQNSTHVSK